MKVKDLQVCHGEPAAGMVIHGSTGDLPLMTLDSLSRVAPEVIKGTVLLIRLDELTNIGRIEVYFLTPYM